MPHARATVVVARAFGVLAIPLALTAAGCPAAAQPAKVAHQAVAPQAVAPLAVAPQAVAVSPTPVRSWMYTNRAAWHTAPGTRVSARLVDRVAGEAVANAVADAEGDVVLAFAVPPTGERTPLGGSNPSLIEPGDTLFVAADDVPVWQIAVPDLSADAEVSPPRVYGTAPAGAAVDITFNGAGRRPFAGTATAGADGRFDLSLQDNFDLRYGDVGWVTLTDAAGHSFTLLAAPLVVEVSLGTPRTRVLGSTSTRPDLMVQTAGTSRGYWPVNRAADPIGTGWTAFLSVFTGDGRDALSSGAVVTATLSGDPLSVARVRPVVIPNIAFDLDVGGTAFIGRAPAGAPLQITIGRPDRATVTFDTAADANGRVRVAVPFAPMPPGSRAELRYDDGRGDWFIAQLVMPQVRVRLYEGVVEGVGQPWQPVTVTLTTPSLPTTYSWPGRTDMDGDFSTTLHPASPETYPPCEIWPLCYETVSLAPGDRIAVEFAGGDPTTLTLPRLTTHTDPDAESVGGEAPGGARVELFTNLPWTIPTWNSQRNEPAPARPVATAVAADDGAYTALLSPAIDIEPPLRGYAVITDQGQLVAAQWTPLVVALTQNIAYVEATGVTNRPISATLRDALGTTVARLDTMRDTGALRDEVGEQPDIVAGDVLDIQRGDDRLVLTVPPLNGRVHVDDDLLVGQGPPGEVIRLIGRSGPVTATVDSAGLFRHDFRADGIDLRYNDPLRAVLALGPGRRHTLNRDLTLPGLTLALHTSRLRGAIEPLLDLNVSADRGPTALARQTTRSDGRAAFSTALAGADGRRLELIPGDRLSVTAPSSALQSALAMAVPTLSIALDAAGDVATGTMPRDASLTVTLGHWFINDYGASTNGWGYPTPGADGRWSTAFESGSQGPLDIRAGSTVDAELRLPSGHVVENRAALPLLSAQVDGSRVCGQAAPLAEVAVTAIDTAGATLLSGNGTADALGLFDLALTDPEGRDRTMAPGTLVRGRLGDADVSLVMPTLGVEVDWDSGIVTALTMPRGEATVEVAAHGCLGRPSGDGGDYDERFLVADGHGRAEVDDFSAEQVAAGVVAAAYTADGMRVYREAHLLIADIYVDTPRLVVTTTARTPLTAALVGADGRPRASAAAVADDTGRGDLSFADTQGRALPIAAGQTVTLDADGDATRIAVEPLSFDVSAGRGLVGLATPGRDVSLRLTLVDGRPIAFVRQTDDRGRFVFTPAMVPPRAGWRWSDVRGVVAAVALPGGHRELSVAVLGAVEPGGPVYLPYGATGGRR
ncbi:MAG: hypothetical protein ABI780_12990 [Ardenticatenales bacterium]